MRNGRHISFFARLGPLPIALALLVLFSSAAALGDDEEPPPPNDERKTAAAEPSLQVEISQPLAIDIQPSDSADSIAKKMVQLEEKLELEGGEAKGFWARKWESVKSKYNFMHRFRVGNREVNSADGQGSLSKVPVGYVFFNGAAAMIGIHIAESTVIGPAFVAAGKLGVLPTPIASGLSLWGGALINPVPTGVPLIDAVTESFCWLTLLVVKTDAFHKGAYRIEMSLAKVGGQLAKALGGERVWNALMERQSGQQRLIKALEQGRSSVIRIPAEELSFRVQDGQQRTLATLELESTPKGDLRLKSFELHPKSQTSEGRKELALALKPFGWDIRDALFKPDALEAGGHGKRVSSGEISRWETNGTSVLLKSNWAFRPERVEATLAATARSLCRFLLGIASGGIP